MTCFYIVLAKQLRMLIQHNVLATLHLQLIERLRWWQFEAGINHSLHCNIFNVKSITECVPLWAPYCIKRWNLACLSDPTFSSRVCQNTICIYPGALKVTPHNCSRSSKARRNDMTNCSLWCSSVRHHFNHKHNKKDCSYFPESVSLNWALLFLHSTQFWDTALVLYLTRLCMIMSFQCAQRVNFKVNMVRLFGQLIPY